MPRNLKAIMAHKTSGENNTFFIALNSNDMGLSLLNRMTHRSVLE